MKLSSLPKGKIMVALSGGADSTALLLVLCEKIGNARVCAFHLNHCLRGGESDRDERFCRELCAREGVEFDSARVAVAQEKRPGESLEEAARRVRYDRLVDAARRMGCDAIATAHTANDVAETVLFNLARGSAGIAGIPRVRELDGIAVVRPMLEVTRAEVEQYLCLRSSKHVEDSTNATDEYTRNLLRHHAIPVLERVNDRAVEHIASAAALAREDEEYLNGEAVWLVECARREGEHRYDADMLSDAARPIASRALRIAYAQVSDRTLERVHIKALMHLCASDDPSAELSLPGGVTARREYGLLVFGAVAESKETIEVPLKVGVNEFGDYRVFAERCVAPNGLHSEGYSPERPIYLRADREYILRTRREGDVLRPKGRGISKPLKKLCVELKIPARERSRLPVVAAADGGCAAFPGYAAEEDFGAAGGADALRVWVVKI